MARTSSNGISSILNALSPKLRLIVVVVLIAGAFGYDWWDRGRGGNGLGIFGKEDSKEQTTSNRESVREEKGPAPGNVSTEKMGGFDVLRGARLTDYRNNDGDSFQISHGGKLYELRLYFVDAPEKRFHEYNEERISHQARYFGITPEQSVEIGLAAKKFVDELLGQGNFTVYTKWEPVYESGRYFAFVEIDRNGKSSLLCEELTERGLSRIYTQGKDLPDGTSEKEFESHLKKIESQAKRSRKGGWRLTNN